MTDQRRKDLKDLQKLDLRIEGAKQRILDFEPLLEEVEQPALTLEGELSTTRTRVQEMKLEERRLELGADEKRVRQTKLEERLGSVRNLREEAAVSAELEMVKRAIQHDEQEALTLLDQLRKAEERQSELEAAYTEATQVVEPQRNELLAGREKARAEVEGLRAERARFVEGMNSPELKVYEAIRAGRRSIAVADLTEDGACGHCYGVIPLQLQNEIRHGAGLIRCEACGVILTAPDPEAAAGEVVASVAAEPPGDDDAAEPADDAGGDEEEEEEADGEETDLR